jgi:hypothetical protein
MTVLTKLQRMGYYGSDFENYFGATNGLLRDGLFSKEPLLSYFPAGYPLLIWPFALISIGSAQTILSVAQSIFFAFATYFFTKSLDKSRIKNLAAISSLLISFNPTLSLATLTVGYEANVAACFMLAAGMMITQDVWIQSRYRYLKVAALSGWLGLASFMQPRYLLAAILILALIAVSKVSNLVRLRMLAVSMAVLMLFPALLIVRNAIAIDKPLISTNLGVTMRIGAGESTNGSYQRQGPELPCENKESKDELSDSDIVKCVLVWNTKNPTRALELVLNKARFFWTPWSGPLQNGTVGRNPALVYSPVMSLNRSSETWHNFIYGFYGELISYLWMIGQLALLIFGIRSLLNLNRRIALIFQLQY